jgi:hypothetical protein
VPAHFARRLARVLGAGHFLRRQRQQPLHEAASRFRHQLVHARLRVLDQLQQRQQHLIVLGEIAAQRLAIIAPHDCKLCFPASLLSATFAHGGFLSLSF